MKRIAIYLRKSRADLEAESRGEGETLAKHKKALLKVAKQLQLNIVKIREEIVSGESLLYRPEMQELLKEVQAHAYDAVLVMDMDRLGRGNMQEQGLILETFRQSKTKIITPRKIYDLEDEWDEEYSEFEAFMARKELKIINRRLQGGRIRSIEDGNYIGTRPPYGYLIEKKGKERYLIPHPEQAPVVKMIFEWYAHDDYQKRLGTSHIANQLNKLGYKTYTEKPWTAPSVLVILKNAVYIGRVQWKKTSFKKSTDVTKKSEKKLRPQEEWIDAKGKHAPLVSEELFYKAQEILKKKYHVPYQLVNGITNPFAGVIKCDLCGSSMVYRPYGDHAPHLKCYNQLCTNKSSRFDYVENAIIKNLKKWLKHYKANWDAYKEPEASTSSIKLKEFAVKSLTREIKKLENQKSKLHDLLERGIYDETTYTDRSHRLTTRIDATKAAIIQAQEELRLELQKEKAQHDMIPRVETVIDLYEKTDDPAKKNHLIKSVLDKVIYRKEKHQRNDQFEITLYPKLPQ
ncbi:recombinase family protein [Brevibacillus laterosporus]|uniref:recombinase family protein n=1 Tax=Brevibacillus laterosporus TaxID=1465 RepID=UPI002654FE79|nr:recombinase family protein [Brevibacillus laterosporus]MDN9010849.1 recombinase family protein [Brevibacillus laterosporus]MDO0941872.1 recombinase family protein [Brevibacillus laterosporus]